MTDEQINLEETIRARIGELPKVVQNAITSADVQKRLRALADSHKLHIDQWQTLENQVMLALLGFLPVEELEDQIKSQVGVRPEVATALATDISRIVFEPIRQELEQELEHPQAKEGQMSGVETARAQLLEKQKSAPENTPPAPKVDRGPASDAYKPGEQSATRKSIEDDPYREPST